MATRVKIHARWAAPAIELGATGIRSWKVEVAAPPNKQYLGNHKLQDVDAFSIVSVDGFQPKRCLK